MDGTYQLWAYIDSCNDISQHKKLIDGESLAVVEQTRAQFQYLANIRYMKAKIEKDEFPSIDYYIRGCNEPTYLIYIYEIRGNKYLYDVAFSGQVIESKVQFLTDAIKKYNLNVHYGVEMRDDSSLRSRSISPLPIEIMHDELYEERIDPSECTQRLDALPFENIDYTDYNIIDDIIEDPLAFLIESEGDMQRSILAAHIMNMDLDCIECYA